MNIITNIELESTGYKNLLEYVKNEGVDSVLNLLQDLKKISNQNLLIRQTLFNNGQNDLSILEQKNKNIIKYLSENKEKYKRIDFTKNGLLEIMKKIKENSSLLDLYLQNAKLLEKLKVSDINFIEDFKNKYECYIYRDFFERIINIRKFYTDGKILPSEESQLNSKSNYSKIVFSLENAKFLLQAVNSENYCQYRNIYITDFGFDGAKLPTKEEIESYEIPKVFIKK